jgi:hypothetical protein
VLEIGTLGLMSGDGKRGAGHRPQATAHILGSTLLTARDCVYTVTFTVAKSWE